MNHILNVTFGCNIFRESNIFTGRSSLHRIDRSMLTPKFRMYFFPARSLNNAMKSDEKGALFGFFRHKNQKRRAVLYCKA